MDWIYTSLVHLYIFKYFYSSPAYIVFYLSIPYWELCCFLGFFFSCCKYCCNDPLMCLLPWTLSISLRDALKSEIELIPCYLSLCSGAVSPNRDSTHIWTREHIVDIVYLYVYYNSFTEDGSSILKNYVFLYFFHKSIIWASIDC